MREPPYVAGVLGGVGTTLIAQALQGVDCGIYGAGRPVHVLVCRSTVHSLHAAQCALQATPAKPVLAVVDDVPGAASWGANTANKVTVTGPYAASIVRVPLVPDWREVQSPHALARSVLAEAEQDLPKGVRTFAHALRDLVTEIVRQAAAYQPRSA